MKVTVVGQGEMNLTSKDFITQGGEGKIYEKNGIVYKIHNDYNHMIPVDKIKELQVLNKDNIIKPNNIILYKNKPIGYTMKYVKDTFALCQLFTKAFKQRNNITDKNILDIFKIMRETIQFVHSKSILLVDLNEMNFLVNNKFSDVYFIDVNSYQTPNFKATAIMESIKDRHCNNNFTEGTDWFSFGIISFQLFIGIHPYKGKHPKYTSLDERMINNISVLNNNVSIPSICPNFSIIPKNLIKWYEAIFEKGERIEPPTDILASTISMAIKTVKSIKSKVLDILLVKKYEEEILNVIFYLNKEIVLTTNTIWFDNIPHINPSQNSKIAFTNSGNPIVFWIENNQIKSLNLIENKDVYFNSNASNIMEYDGRVYFQNYDKVVEVQLTESKNIVFATSKVVCSILEKNSQFFDGIVIQSMLNETTGQQTYFMSVFPNKGECRQFFMPELSQYRIINAKYSNHIACFIALNNTNGKYDFIITKIKEDYSSYEITKTVDVQITDINLVTLNNGVCVFINDEEKVQILSNKVGSNTSEIIDDPISKEDIKLYCSSSKIYFTKGSELFSMTKKH